MCPPFWSCSASADDSYSDIMKRDMCNLWKTALCGLLLCATPVWAQKATVRASLDSTYVIIGSPTTIHLEASAPEGVTVQFPQLRQAIDVMDGEQHYQLEISNLSAVDTTRTAGSNVLTLRQEVEVYAFDSATMYIPPFLFVDGTDTLATQSLALKVVVPFEVELDPQKYFDIKAPIKPEFVWMDYLAWVLYPLFALLVLAAAWYYFFVYRRKHRRGAQPVVPVTPPLPPHEAAMLALQALDEKQLWQHGFEKRYYTELTDILRAYIEARFELPAMEKTSDEILREMRQAEGSTTSSLQNLRQVLQLADLVKFARWTPAAEDNQLSFMNARMFVSQTVEVKSVDTTPAVADLNDEPSKNIEQ